MPDRPRRIVVIDDHPSVAIGLAADAGLDVVADFSSVEAFIRAKSVAPVDVVLLDLQLGGQADGRLSAVRRGAGRASPMSGTAAIRALIDAGKEPVVIYSGLTEEMLLAACLAAGAMGVVAKSAPTSSVLDVIDVVMGGAMWFDPSSAGALRRYAERLHAGALSEQQANALLYRGQGLKHQAIARQIGVKDPKVVDSYLRSAVQKLADLTALDDDVNPGALIDDVARRSGLASGLVRWADLHVRPHRRRR